MGRHLKQSWVLKFSVVTNTPEVLDTHRGRWISEFQASHDDWQGHQILIFREDHLHKAGLTALRLHKFLRCSIFK